MMGYSGKHLIELWIGTISLLSCRLYDANKGDVVFICGPLIKNVHSVILGARSKVFDTMLNGSFQVVFSSPTHRLLSHDLHRKHIASELS